MEEELEGNAIDFVFEGFGSFRKRFVIPFSGFESQFINNFNRKEFSVGFESLNDIELVGSFGKFVAPLLFEFLKLELVFSDGFDDRAKE